MVEETLVLDTNIQGSDTEGLGVTEVEEVKAEVEKKKIAPEDTFFIQRKDKSVEAINLRRRFITKLCRELGISRKKFKKWYKDKRDLSFKNEVEIQFSRFTSDLN